MPPHKRQRLLEAFWQEGSELSVLAPRPPLVPLALVPIPQQHDAVNECRVANGELFTRLQQWVLNAPELALACAGMLDNRLQRDRILRDAFVTAASLKPDVAVRYLPQAMGRPWLADAGFFPLAALAAMSPGNARLLLLRAAERYPALALREYRDYAGLPFGPEVFERAALAAPDEAVGIACGHSVRADEVRTALLSASGPDLRVLASLAENESVGGYVRQRAAVFYRQIAKAEMPISKAIEVAGGTRFFPAVAALRIGALGDEAALYDRVLENYAEMLFRACADGGSLGELQQLSAGDVYLLLNYGRTEADDLLFGRIFDVYLLPKLRVTRPSRLIDEVREVHLRRFLSAAAAHHRLDAFLSMDLGQGDLLARALRGVEGASRPLDDALELAEIVEAIPDGPRLLRMKTVAMEEYKRDQASRALYGLMVAAIARKLPASQINADPHFQQVAAQYQPFFKEPRVLDAASLFNSAGLCVQEELFYDDEDAAESFKSFQRIHSQDEAWHWEDCGWYVRVTAGTAFGRRIEIYANVPRSLRPEGGPWSSADRRHALTKLLGEKGLVPSVLVHRGHTWYVEQSLRYLAPSTRLVFLGSCRGFTSTYGIVAVANRAQIIATRGVGTHVINDPLLKAINDELLRGAKVLEWDSFWRAQKARLGARPEFADYIPPPRNAAAIMLAAYYDCLADGKVDSDSGTRL